MMRLLFLFVPVLALGLLPVHAQELTGPPSPPVDFQHLPWSNGESLTYQISWTTLIAAEGTFVAQNKGDHWQFNLKMASAGMVNDMYPFTGYFWSILGTSPWRSVEYGEYRYEPKRTIKEQTMIDYAKHEGTRHIWTEGQTKTFTFTENSIDDVGTMLYHLRTCSWKPGDKRLLYVYESNSQKEGLAECQGRETRAFGTWPSQSLLRVFVQPGKGTHHRGSLMVWMTDDARHLPLHAELDFRYGVFSLDLIKADKTLPVGH
jgi:hypothetical protein